MFLGCNFSRLKRLFEITLFCLSPPAFAGIDEIVPTVIRKNHYFFITSFSQYTTICFVSFFFIRFSMNICASVSLLGGDDGIRTHDPLLAGQVLSQLSYTPINVGYAFFSLVGPSGLEPPTSCLSGTRSNLLSYEPMWLVCDSHTWFFLSSGEDFSSLVLKCRH